MDLVAATIAHDGPLDLALTATFFAVARSLSFELRLNSATFRRTKSAMIIKIGEVEALYRYPVKSMMGEGLDIADLGWHGLDGDRRLAFRRVDDRGGFPWLTASKLPELILFAPQRRGPAASGDLPTHVHTPEGQELS